MDNVAVGSGATVGCLNLHRHIQLGCGIQEHGIHLFVNGGIVTDNRAVSNADIPCQPGIDSCIVAGVGHVHGNGDIGLYPGCGEIGTVARCLLSGGGGGINAHRSPPLLGKPQSLHDNVGTHPVIHGSGGDSVVQKKANIGIKVHRISQRNGLQGIRLVQCADVNGQIRCFQPLFFTQLPGVYHGAVDDSVFRMNPNLVAGEAGCVYAADVGHLQKALRGHRCNHQANLICVTGHQHTEGGLGIHHRRHRPHFVHRDSICNRQHMAIDFLFNLCLAAGYTVGVQQLH